MITAAIHSRLSGDATLAALLSTYEALPAVFTIDPAPEEAMLPYIVTVLFTYLVMVMRLTQL